MHAAATYALRQEC